MASATEAAVAPGILAAWHVLTPSEVCRRLKTDARSGLTADEAFKRLQLVGPNALTGRGPPGVFTLLVHHTLDFLMILLLVASAVSFAVQEWIDGGVILAIALVNIFIGVAQEYRAEKTLDALRNLAAARATVRRRRRSSRDTGSDAAAAAAHQLEEVDATELVPGDVIVLDATSGSAASAVPADARVLESYGLRVAETSLTGESRPVAKQALWVDEPASEEGGSSRFYSTMVYSGTTVTGGRGVAVVVHTGMKTQLGGIAAKVTGGGGDDRDAGEDDSVSGGGSGGSLLRKKKGLLGRVLGGSSGGSGGRRQLTGLQREMRRVAAALFVAGIVLAFVVFAANKFNVDYPDGLRYTAIYAIALIVAIIPEELPLVLTLTMVVGTRRMASQRVIVRRLAALEQLGRVTDICSDKTGTLTTAVMSAVAAHLPSEREWFDVTGPGLSPYGSVVRCSEEEAGSGGTGGGGGKSGAAAPAPVPPSSAAAAFSAPVDKPDQARKGWGDGEDEQDRMERGAAAAAATALQQQLPSSSSPAALELLSDILSFCNSSELRLGTGGARRGKEGGGPPSSWSASGSPTDGALRALAAKLGRTRGTPLELSESQGEFVVADFPFDSSVKRASVVVAHPAKPPRGPAPPLLDRRRRGPTALLLSAYLKGAPDRIVALCSRTLAPSASSSAAVTVVPMTAEVRASVDAAVASMTARGLRVLALAARGAAVGDEGCFVGEEDGEGGVGEGSGDKEEEPGGRAGARLRYYFQGLEPASTSPPSWTRDAVDAGGMALVGLVGLADPPRPGVVAAVADCVRGGVAVRMLTGDAAGTALAVAAQVGIVADAARGPASVTAARFAAMDAARFDALGEAAADDLVDLPRVVSRCTPDSKVGMVRALHRRRRVVAMTGDGVNDAPALKIADVGVAMGIAGSELSKQAADLVLADDNFVSIVAAVREGRRIFAAIRTFAVHILSANVGMASLMMLGLAVRDSRNEVVFPQAPLAILWLNMFVLSLPVPALVLEPPAGDPMARPPQRSRRVLTRASTADLAVYGALLGAVSFSAYAAVLYAGPGAFPGAGAGAAALDVGVGGASGVRASLKCNVREGKVGCGPVMRARSVAFAVIALVMQLGSYSVKLPERPVWELVPLPRCLSSRSRKKPAAAGIDLPTIGSGGTDTAGGDDGNLADNYDTLSTPEGRAAAAAFAARVTADAAEQRKEEEKEKEEKKKEKKEKKKEKSSSGNNVDGGGEEEGGLVARAVSGSVNWLQLACVTVALSTVVAFIYAPVVSTDVFHQAPIGGREWGVVAAALAVYALLGQVAWKLFLRPRIVRALEVDQREAILASMTWAAGERLNTAE